MLQCELKETMDQHELHEDDEHVSPSAPVKSLTPFSIDEILGLKSDAAKDKVNDITSATSSVLQTSILTSFPSLLWPKPTSPALCRGNNQTN